MNKQLPERSNLEQLKTQAKDLLNEVRAGQAGALVRIGNENRETFALHDAQRVLAREYGFPSWPKLKLHVETRAEDDAEARLIEAALHGQKTSVEALLAERPHLGRRSIYSAATLGDPEGLKQWLQQERGLATRAGGARQAEPLLYVGFGRHGGSDADRAEAARLLLALGADANVSYIHPDWPKSPQPVLYGATGANNYPRLARVLLEAGANPNDPESRYHAAEHNHVECLELLLRHGTDFDGKDATWGNTPLYFLFGYHHPPEPVKAGIRWLLEHGANPNRPSYVEKSNETALHAALRNGWDTDMIALLVRHGADPTIPRLDGRTPYALAVRGGREDVVALFKAAGAKEESSATDQFLSACMRADTAVAWEWLRKEPQIVASLSDLDRLILHEAAQSGRAAALQLMGELGFNLGEADGDRVTPLHWAAWHGWPEAVRALVRAGVPLDPLDKSFNAPPMGWCAHGSQFGNNPRGDYAAVAEILVEAGAKVPPGTTASPAVMAVLKKHGKT
jgi:ankyrin repeat protein